MNEAEDVVLGFPIDRNAGTLRGGERAHHFVQRGFDGERVHIRARDHNFANLELAQLDRAEDELLFPGSEQAAFARLLDLDLELFGGVSDAVAR